MSKNEEINIRNILSIFIITNFICGVAYNIFYFMSIGITPFARIYIGIEDIILSGFACIIISILIMTISLLLPCFKNLQIKKRSNIHGIFKSLFLHHYEDFIKKAIDKKNKAIPILYLIFIGSCISLIYFGEEGVSLILVVLLFIFLSFSALYKRILIPHIYYFDKNPIAYFSMLFMLFSLTFSLVIGVIFARSDILNYKDAPNEYIDSNSKIKNIKIMRDMSNYILVHNNQKITVYFKNNSHKELTFKKPKTFKGLRNMKNAKKK